MELLLSFAERHPEASFAALCVVCITITSVASSIGRGIAKRP